MRNVPYLYHLPRGEVVFENNIYNDNDDDNQFAPILFMVKLIVFKFSLSTLNMNSCCLVVINMIVMLLDI